MNRTQAICAETSRYHSSASSLRSSARPGVGANVGKPQVAYRETITQPAAGKVNHKMAGIL